MSQPALDLVAIVTAQQDQIDELAAAVRAQQDTLDRLIAAVEALQGRSESPDVVIAGAARTFLSITAGQLTPEKALATGGIQTEGDPEARARCLKMLARGAS